MTDRNRAYAWDQLLGVITDHKLVSPALLQAKPDASDDLPYWLARSARFINEDAWLDAVEGATGISSYNRVAEMGSALDKRDREILARRYGALLVSPAGDNELRDASVVGLLNPYLQVEVEQFLASLGINRCVYVAISPHFFRASNAS